MKSNEVYKITNKVTNKVYIGITNQGSGARYRHHWYESRIGEPSPIHRSMAKYGEESFTLEIIDFADTYDELKEKEKYWIKQYNSTDRTIGYNLTEGGDGTFGKKLSEETKAKMYESRKGKCSDKQREHLSKLQEQCKQKVYQYSKQGEFIAEYNSIIEACKALNLNRDTIRRQLKNPPKNLKDHRIKFLWKTEKTDKY